MSQRGRKRGPAETTLGGQKRRRNPTLETPGRPLISGWERHTFHGKTSEARETQGTLEASRVFLGLSLIHI
eukprot:7959188-Pyramimonas_sp.AAC.1